MHNFNTLLEITAGLNLVPIRRLRKTWRVCTKLLIVTLLFIYISFYRMFLNDIQIY